MVKYMAVAVAVAVAVSGGWGCGCGWPHKKIFQSHPKRFLNQCLGLNRTGMMATHQAATISVSSQTFERSG